MDNKELHDLEQNDLVHFITHFKQWWTKHGTNTLLIICVALGSYVGINWYKNKDANYQNEASIALADALHPGTVGNPISVQTRVNNLLNVKTKFSDLPIANRALLQAAELLREDALFNLDASATKNDGTDIPAEQSDKAKNEQLRKTIKFYDEVIKSGEAKNQLLAMLNARMGLASVYESLNEFDKATEQYNAIIKSTGHPYSTIRDQASYQLNQLAKYRKPIVFPPAPKIEKPLDLPALPALQNDTKADDKTETKAEDKPATPAP